jgi:two-component system, NtrC family, nitrogen regulation response regulator NtrX
LDKEILNNNFREDLYHRLSVIIIHVPPLRERKDDIPLLVEYFSNEIARSQGKQTPVFEKEAIETLQKLPWTGNIRELRMWWKDL